VAQGNHSQSVESSPLMRPRCGRRRARKPLIAIPAFRPWPNWSRFSCMRRWLPPRSRSASAPSIACAGTRTFTGMHLWFWGRDAFASASRRSRCSHARSCRLRETSRASCDKVEASGSQSTSRRMWKARPTLEMPPGRMRTCGKADEKTGPTKANPKACAAEQWDNLPARSPWR